MSELERCVAFVRALDERRARRVVPFRFGKALFEDELPRVHDLNLLSVDLDAEPSVEELVAEAERLQGGAGLEHRKIAVENQDLGERLAAGFREQGWKVERLLVMPSVHPGKEVDSARVAEVDSGTLAPTWAAGIRSEPWGSDEEVVRQLVEAQLLRQTAVRVRYFAALQDGRPVSYCELFSDGDTGQIESVLTLPEHRGKGYASAVVSKALAESHAMGHALTFLLADEDDWPQELYRKLGFEAVGRVFEFTKAKLTRDMSRDQARLRAIRLRTSRLELRLPTRNELVALAEVALAGIHPPEEMPFAVAWTDTLTLDSFVAFHEELLASWRPDDWTLNLVTFLDGRPIGAQGMGAERFAEQRTVVTGSWLGAPFQGQGFGTEMRAAVLELAFRGLGAQIAKSGAMQGNIASTRVSEKLGYEPAGEGTRSPRRQPVPEIRYRLRRDTWRSPIRVEIDALEPARPLFGAP
jgi:RimJ/RimL family protein N-acetyltransferase